MNFKNKELIEKLGDLTEQQKKDSCWAQGTLSGSRIDRVMREPLKLLSEWLGDLPEEDIFSNPVVAEKIKYGNIMEPVIFDLAKKELGLDIILDKNTYHFKDMPYYFNIDGVSGDGETIFEIKNTETTSIDILVERYRNQGIWYSIMTGADHVTYIFFIRGFKLRTKTITPTESEKMDMMEKANIFLQAFSTGNYDLITWGSEREEVKNVIAITDELARQKLSDLIMMQEDAKQLEDEIKSLKEYFGEAIGEGGSYIDELTGNKVSIVRSNRKGGVDVEKMLEKDPSIQLLFKPDFEAKSIRITKGKIKNV